MTKSAFTWAHGGGIEVAKNGASPELSPSLLPLGILRTGLVKSCCVWAQQDVSDPDMTPAQREEAYASYYEYMFCLTAMTRLVQENQALKALVLETIQLPSWWRLLTFSIELFPKLDLTNAEPVETPFGPGYRIPMELIINGDPALYATLTAVEPRGVLQMTAGIIALDGFAPDRPDDVLTVRFVGAESSPGESASAPVVSKVHWR